MKIERFESNQAYSARRRTFVKNPRFASRTRVLVKFSVQVGNGLPFIAEETLWTYALFKASFAQDLLTHQFETGKIDPSAFFLPAFGFVK